MKIQRFKQFINESEGYLDEPSNELANELLQKIAEGLRNSSSFMVHLDEKNSTLHIDQDWNIDDLNFQGEEPRVYASYAVRLKLAFQDDESLLAPELVRLWKLGLAPITDLIKGFDHAWAFGVDSKDVPQLDITDGDLGNYEFISIEDLTGGIMDNLDDIESFCHEFEETINNWLDEHTYMLYDRIQEELDMIAGEDEDEDAEEDDEEFDDEEYSDED
jgi:hypothetical protein